MPAQTNLNVSPYFDDFDPNNNFYRVLFKAGFPVQARELTQSQSILQDQIEKLGSVILKDGDKVVPGEFSLGVPIPYVRLSTITQGSTIDEFVGYRVTGVTSGVVAFVNYAEAATDDDDTTIYVNYESSGQTAESNTFLEGETLESDHPNFYTATVGVTNVSKPITSPAIGQGSLFTVSGGSYYINGFIVRNDSQTISLDKYGTTPTWEVGFLVSERFVNSSEDTSLLDNSQGSSNFAAPGADRLQIALTLSKREPDTTNPNFIQLASIQQGNILGKPDQTIKWDWLYDILARRTFDESGDYIVEDFPIRTLEYWNSEQVDGVFDPDPELDTYPPVPGSGLEERLTPAEADENYAVEISRGKAYVQGYEVGFRNPAYVYGKKPRDTSFIQNTLTQITPGYNITLTNVFGGPDFQNIDGDAYARGFDDVVLYRNFVDGYVGESTDASGRPLNTGNSPWVTYHLICDEDIGAIVSIQQDAIVFNEGNSAVVTSATPIYRGDSIGSATVLISTEVRPTPAGVIKPRYILPNQRVDNQDGFFGYNSTYKMGSITSNYFTELAVIGVTNPTTEWTIGNLVYGESSAAIGIVEDGTTTRRLIVSNIIGEFQAGEEITQDDKVSRVLKQGEVSAFNFTDPGDLSAATELTVKAIGSELVLKANVDWVYDATSNAIVPNEVGIDKMLNFPYPEGSTFSTRINYDVETDNSIKGYAVILDFKITNTLSKTKSCFSDLADTNDFSADISVQNNVDAEIVDIANRSLFSGDPGTNFITCDNLSGDPTDQLVASDIVTFVDDEGRSINRVVLFVTRPVGYGELRSKSRIYFTTTIPNKVTGKTVQRVRVQAAGSPEQNLMFQLPQQVVASLESDPLSTRISYQVYREFLIEVTGGSSEFTLVTNETNNTFVADPNLTSISIAKNVGDPTDSARLEGRALTATVLTQDNGRKAVYSFTGGLTLPTDLVLKVIAPVFVNNAVSKRKVLIKEHELIIPADESGVPVISLQQADVFIVREIKMLTPNGNFVDVTENYIIDNGQRDNVYDIGRLILKQGRPVATGQLDIIFDYFEHSNEGDFFSVDSYTDDNGTGFIAVPFYTPQTAINKKGSGSTIIQLRDVVDFRPIVNTGGTSPSVIPSIVPGRGQQGAKNFLDTTFENSLPGAPDAGIGFVPRLPIPGSQFQCDIEHYLPRVDSLFIEKDGSLNLVSGQSAQKPLPPPDLSTGIRLYDIYLPPYTFSIKNAKVQKFNYKRYRMKDIGDINRRIDRIEELVTLSLLEQSAINMSVRDAVTGLERFKNGIVVDTFRDHKKGDINSSQYRNSIDPIFTHLRAAHFTDQVELEQENQTPLEKEGMGYRQTGPLLTCDYQSQRMIQNPFATRFINLQPYTVFTYDGNMELTPSVDSWQETNRLPDLVIEDNNLFNAFVGFSDEMAASGIGTQWGDWETTGQSSTSNTVRIGNTEDNPNATRNALNALAIAGTNVNIDAGAINQGGREMLDRGEVPPIVVTNTTTSTQQMREQNMTRINVGTARIENTSYGDRVVDVKLAETMRAQRVIFQAYRMKPNTRYYAFFDDIAVNEWCSPDTIQTDFPDGVSRYAGLGGTTNKGFGLPLISDDVGTLSGIFIIPSGRAPVANSIFTRLQDVQYQTTGPTRSFTVGERVFRVTTSAGNVKDPSQIEGFAEAGFFAQGVLMDKQETIVSTRIPSFSHTTTTVNSETRVTESTEQSANYFDPVAQTFLIDENNTDGVFATELDIFFRTKDSTQGVEAYLTTTEGQVPTEQILPFSRVVKNTDTTLRVICELGGTGDTSTTFDAGVTVIGSESGATGTVKSVVAFETQAGNATSNVNNTVYNVILDNYVGEFVPGESIVPQTSPANTSVFTIVSDEVHVNRVDIKQLGSGYSAGTTIVFSPPELPGGVTATGSVKLGADGEVYDVTLINPGRGYIRIPSATIVDGGSSGGDAIVEVRAELGTQAVDMGVCTSEDATAATKFKFQAPVYLLGDTNYAFVIKAPTSLNFTIWTSKLGENLLGTETRVVEQPNMGALFMSQNGALWTEDQTQDVSFVLHRAEFQTNQDAIIKLRNAPLTVKPCFNDPIETNSTPASDPNSTVFGDNPNIIRVSHYNHGLLPGDVVAFEDVIGDPGGITNDEFNSIHTVIDSSIHTFTVKMGTAATTSGRGGGNNVRSSFNRPFEVINVVTGAMAFGSTDAAVVNRATECAGLSGYNQPLQYRLDTPVNINMMESFYYNGAKQVAHQLNEAKYGDSAHLQGRRSLETTITISTFNSKVSPVIDVDRTNATVIRNLIDNPKPNDPIFGPAMGTVTVDSTFAANALTNNQTINLDSLPVRVDSFNGNTKKIKISGHNVAKLASAAAIDVAGMNVARVTTTAAAEDYVPETSNRGSVHAKWLSRLFIFENPCDGLEVKIAAIFYNNDAIRVYYRPRNIGFDGDISDVNWIPFNETGLPDNADQIAPRSNETVDPSEIISSDWQSLTWTVQDTAKFDGVAFKVVMTSDNPAYAPLLDDIQIVASE